LGVSDVAVLKWERGENKPSPAYRQQLEVLASEARGASDLNPEEVAREFGVSVRAVYTNLRNVKLKARVEDNRWRIRASDVDTWKRTRYNARGSTTQSIYTAQRMVIPDDYATRVKALRLQLGLTLAEFAKRIGVKGKKTTWQWENNRRAPMPRFWRRILELEVGVAE
jgi:DNA-binding transcriptional regulator YiaG